MAGVTNHCRFCNTTVYDEETAYKTCPSCNREKWQDFPHAPKYQEKTKYPEKTTLGYHLAEIPQGTVGELSKLLEEVHEAMDAEAQGNPIMVLAELGDLYGAIQIYLQHHHPKFTMEHLAKMAEATNRAFISGRRVRKQG